MRELSVTFAFCRVRVCCSECSLAASSAQGISVISSTVLVVSLSLSCDGFAGAGSVAGGGGGDLRTVAATGAHANPQHTQAVCTVLTGTAADLVNAKEPKRSNLSPEH